MLLLEEHQRVVNLSIQSCFNVTHEDVSVLVECYPSGHGSSLNLLILVFVSGAVSHVDVPSTFAIRVFLTYIDVSFSIITFVFNLFDFHSH